MGPAPPPPVPAAVSAAAVSAGPLPRWAAWGRSLSGLVSVHGLPAHGTPPRVSRPRGHSPCPPPDAARLGATQPWPGPLRALGTVCINK